MKKITLIISLIISLFLNRSCQEEYDIFNQDILYGSMSDIEGNIYKTIKIGAQEWMAENLKTTKYFDGTAIPNVIDDADWLSLTTGAYCWYQNAASNKKIYGALYNWYAVMNGKSGSNDNPSGIQGICPDDWHLPSDEEWIALENYLIVNGYNYDRTTTGFKVAKSMASQFNWTFLKEENITGSPGKHPESNNSSGFSGLPGGIRSNMKNQLTYRTFGQWGYWWTTNENSSTTAWSQGLKSYEVGLDHRNYNKGYGLSVRCVKD